ncbi:hypothetical protein M427DRAFT_53138 [Gonapodya prolifera JEL478]|uniref:Uncharacterized protein n=1 Tax=Gonapodya prolifera (strain JEL478) TaxID=1344416 RepID=A0A139AR07_GONPJ|nr:hypothetical protein M427DRAFT_53138 [Gonapodya prolifera JEL478]|eukprot:KXS19166.1 hypothetical protein M427DRAFT_53138 [Gonapodya prolifera JEL478]
MPQGPSVYSQTRVNNRFFKYLSDFVASYPHEDNRHARMWSEVAGSVDDLVQLTREESTIDFLSSSTVKKFVHKDVLAKEEKDRREKLEDNGYYTTHPGYFQNDPSTETLPYFTALYTAYAAVKENSADVGDWATWLETINAIGTLEETRDSNVKQTIRQFRQLSANFMSNKLPPRRTRTASRSRPVNADLYIPTGFVPKSRTKSAQEDAIVIDSDTESEAGSSLNGGAAWSNDVDDFDEAPPNFDEEYKLRLDRCFGLNEQVAMRAELLIFEMKRQYTLNAIATLPSMAARIAKCNEVFRPSDVSAGLFTQEQADADNFFFPERNPRNALAVLMTEDAGPRGRQSEKVRRYSLRHPFRRSRALFISYLRQQDRLWRELGYIRRHMISNGRKTRSTYMDFLKAAQGSDSNRSEREKALVHGFGETGFGGFPNSPMARYGLYEEGVFERIAKWAAWEREGGEDDE